MKIYLQWATDPPQGWQQLDHRQWPDLPIKPEPTGGEVIDANPGWVHRVNVQGTIFSGDHVAVGHQDNEVLVWQWDDDPEETTADTREGALYRFSAVTPDPRAGMRLNTRATVRRYDKRNFILYPYPHHSLIRHGIWMPDTLAAELNKHKPHGWQHWIGEAV